MAIIGEMHYLTIGDKTYSIPVSGGSTVTITRNLTSGTKSATINVDGTNYDIYSMTVPTNISSFTNDVGYLTSGDIPEGASAYTGTISAVGTSASSGTNNGFARGDHVHNITGTTITSALGYTPYNSTNPNGYITSSQVPEEIFKVTATYSNSNWSLNKTLTEIEAAYQAGKEVVITTDRNSTLGTEYHFEKFTDDGVYIFRSGASQITVGSNFVTSSTTLVQGITTTAGAHTTISGATGSVTFNVPTKTSHLVNDSGYVTTDENLKWTASTSSNTYYPLVSTSTATTSTANTLNGIDFYQYYNTAGGYRRLDLGNSTAYKSSGGAYGTIRLYGAAATYYGDLVPGVLGTTSGDGHISANRTWTLPDKTGTVALTSDIPTVPTLLSGTTLNTTPTQVMTALSAGRNIEIVHTDSTYGDITAYYFDYSNGFGAIVSNIIGVYNFDLYCFELLGDLSNDTWSCFVNTIAKTADIPTKVSDLTNDAGYITTYTDTNTTYSLSGALSSHKFTSTLTAGGSGSGTSTSDFTLAAGTGISLTDNTSTRTVTIATNLTVPTITLNGSSTTSPSFYAPTGAGTSGQYLKSNGSGAPSWTNFPTIPSITLNGSSSTSPSFYAPTSAGTNGYVLKSNGSGAPSWTSLTIPSITLNGSSTTSPSFYAPTSAGTSGYYLKSNGSGAPTWASITIPTVPTNVSAFTNDSGYITGVTATQSGSGNVVTDISASGGTITYTMGTVSTTAAQIIRW